VLGLTLTLLRDRGNLLIAFTAVFVAFISTRFWRIACFIFHRAYSTSFTHSPESPQNDGLHFQRQAVLRNAATPESSLWNLLLVGWAWRRAAKKPVFRILPVVVCAAVCICGFTLAGGFSSMVSTAVGDEVLLDGANCSLRDYNARSGKSPAQFLAINTRMVSDASNYAQQCYTARGGPGTTGIFDCNSLKVPRLGADAKVDTGGPCPFKDPSICYGAASNLVLDTGLIDSRDHLGLNSRLEERILMRQVLSCAPLRTDGFTRQVSTPSENYTDYHYGPLVAQVNHTSV